MYSIPLGGRGLGPGGGLAAEPAGLTPLLEALSALSAGTEASPSTADCQVAKCALYPRGPGETAR